MQIYDSGSQTKKMFLLGTSVGMSPCMTDFILALHCSGPYWYITWFANHSTDSNLLLLQYIKFYKISAREGEVISLGTQFNSFSFTTCISLEFDWSHRRERNRVTRNLKLYSVQWVCTCKSTIYYTWSRLKGKKKCKYTIN